MIAQAEAESRLGPCRGGTLAVGCRALSPVRLRPRWDWFGDDTIPATAWISAIAGLVFVWRSLTYAQPIVDLRALKSRNFSLGCFFSFVTGIGIFGTIYLTPLFLGRVRGFSVQEIGPAVFRLAFSRYSPFQSTHSAPAISICGG
jgi:hypothetical protein